MGKHSVKNRTPRNAGIVAAVGVVAGMAAPATVSAAPLAQVPSVLNSGAQQISQGIGGVASITSGSSSAQGSQKTVPVKETNSTAVGSSVPAQSSAPSIGSSSSASTVSGQSIVDAAMSKVGAPYVWGASGPNAFDCSGLTSWAYRQVGKSIPRTSGAQASSGVPVSRADLRPGDIISYYGGASHVAIYIGNNKIVHALNQSSPVRVDNIDYLPLNNIVRF